MSARTFLVLAMAGCVAAWPAKLNGFQPIQGARGPSPTPLQNPHHHHHHNPSRPARTADFQSGGNGQYHSSQQNSISTHSTSSLIGGPSYQTQQSAGPDKTIYVRLPAENVQQPAPISAGPPQKHYRIVIIKSPTPPAVQPILPPRNEQKTIIYVLHQKPKVQQQVIETPVVKHAPQVLFVGYDDELSTDDLQKLAKGDHSGFSVTSQQDPHLTGVGAAAVNPQPTYGDSR